MGLKEYKKKRDFNATPEPEGGESKNTKELTFVIQRHQATRLHYDFRLELDGVLKSWAVPKGPSMVAGEKHLAVMVEDHPLDYAEFYGEIPEGNYGAGIVDIFDKGTYTPYNAPPDADPQQHLLSQIEKGDLKVVLKGKYIKGAFAIVRLKGNDNEKSSNWLIIKKKDAFNLSEFDIESLKPVKKTRKTKKKKANPDDFRKNIPEDKVWIKKEEDKTPASQAATQPGIIVNPDDEGFAKEQSLSIGRKKVKLTNLNKVFWPDEGYTKGDLIKYYLEISDYILPYLKDRPQSLNRFPNGIKGPSFYHKDMEVGQLPEWAKTVSLYSKANDHNIDYLICNDLPSLLYMANLGCIEINPWHSTYKKEDFPDYFMLDLDPGDISFKEVVNTALVVKEISDELKIDAYCKTSGATGLHIYFPLGARYDYDQVKIFAEILANLTQSRIPSVTTVERTVSKRGNKIYVDFLQNRKGQTIAAPYSVRPRPLATVSTPLDWKEVNHNLTPEMFTIQNIIARLEKVGDLWQGIFKNPVKIPEVLKRLEKLK
ncbi:MAG TPA: non-homologous end-joining DNA ligase [Lentimicrobium sp.]|nr:non-homologous end-joining DNA ligase [Lentimicrobium sp.]